MNGAQHRPRTATTVQLRQDDAATFRALHRGPGVLVVPNAWDVVSARLFEDAGFACVGTTSAGIAWSLGYADGERLPRDEMLGVVGRIAECVTLPVTADIERGYGASPERVFDTVRRAVAAGAVGVNLEDATGDARRPLFDPARQVERVAAAREAADAGGLGAVVNARADVFWLQVGAPESRLDHALGRLSAYQEAGADCAFVPGVLDPETIRTLAAGVDAPLNILAGPGVPGVQELAQLGVARVSVGSALFRLAASLVRRAAVRLRETGGIEGIAADTLSYSKLDLLAGAVRPWGLETIA